MRRHTVIMSIASSSGLCLHLNNRWETPLLCLVSESWAATHKIERAERKRRHNLCKNAILLFSSSTASHNSIEDPVSGADSSLVNSWAPFSAPLVTHVSLHRFPHACPSFFAPRLTRTCSPARQGRNWQTTATCCGLWFRPGSQRGCVIGGCPWPGRNAKRGSQGRERPTVLI